MNKIEVLKQKIKYQKQWLWMLINLSEEELQLPRNKSKQDAINESLDELYYLKRLLNRYENE